MVFEIGAYMSQDSLISMLTTLRILLLGFDFQQGHRLFISSPYLYQLWIHPASCLVGSGGNSLCEEVARA